MRKIVTVLMAGTLLTGCAGRYMPLYIVSAPVEGQTTQARMAATLRGLHDRADVLEKSYRRASREADFAQLPLIGVAVALGLIALNKPDNAAKTIGRIGIGVGAYAATRSVLAPSGGPEPLRKGVDAINCVLAEGPVFVGDGIQAKVDDLERETTDVDGTAAQVAADASLNVVPANETEAKELQLAQANAKLALARTAPVTQAARTQLGAYDNAAGEFDRAGATIFSTLATRTSVRTVIDSSALAASWTKPAQSATGAAQGAGPDRAADVIRRLNENRGMLDADTATLASHLTAFHFAERLKEVVKCPAIA